MSLKKCDYDKKEIAKNCSKADYNFSWDKKKDFDSECRLIPRKIKETIHSPKNLNYILIKNFAHAT